MVVRYSPTNNKNNQPPKVKFCSQSQELFASWFMRPQHGGQAEAVAVQEAIKWKTKSFPQNKCHIHTDSLSILVALQNQHIKNDLVQWIRNHLDQSISLHWVKAHIGIEGNKAAKKAANSAARRGSVDVNLGIPERTVKRHLKELLLSECKNRWDNCGSGQFIHNFSPKFPGLGVRSTNLTCKHFPIIGSAPGLRTLQPPKLQLSL
ncbi:hypothetical protein AVEN_259297-1 [Araneus ventricosus]|uniref:RNase H type-1 domain-containing protein n=1 Tax=Araneus ventricosus TaxID=182803 RepID=A0A4Y2GJG5_ARAVE|nr:hypothetical protein AVEN_259297-1 [Araneus ventricosus]